MKLHAKSLLQRSRRKMQDYRQGPGRLCRCCSLLLLLLLLLFVAVVVAAVVDDVLQSYLDGLDRADAEAAPRPMASSSFFSCWLTDHCHDTALVGASSFTI